MNPIGSVSQAAAAQASLAAADFGRVSPSVIQDIEAAAARLFSDAAAANLAATGHTLPDGAPELRSPDLSLAYGSFVEGGEDAARNLSSGALLTQLTGKLIAQVQQTNAAEILANAELVSASRAQLEGSLRQQVAAEAEAEATLDAALDAALEAADEAQRRIALVNQATQRVGELQSRLDGLPSGSERQQVAADLDAAKRELETLRASAQDALTAADEANATVIDAQDELTRVRAESDRLASLTLPSLNLQRDYLTNAAKFDELMAKLHMLVGKAAQSDLENQIEKSIAQLKQQEAESKRLAEEQAKKLEEAARLQKTMGCFMKIAMALLTVVAAIATVATGGIAGAVIGLAVFALFAISDAAGFNIAEKAFEPLMEHVIQPLINALAKGLAELAVRLGADPAEAEKIAKYVATAIVALVVVAIVIAVMALAKSPQGVKLLDKITTMATNAANKLMPGVVDAASKLSTQLTATVAKHLGSDAAKTAARVQVGAAVGQTLVQTTGGVGTTVAADKRVEAAEAGAAVDLGLVNSNLVRERMRAAQEEFSKTKEFQQALLLQMSAISAQAAQSSAGMLANLSNRPA